MTQWPQFQYLFALIGTGESSAAFLEARRRFGLQRDTVRESAYWEAPTRGIAFSLEQGRIDTVFLFGNGKDGFDDFCGALIPGLSFGSTKEQIRDAIGDPMDTGEALELGEAIRHGGWDAYVLGTKRLHLTYAADTMRLTLITLSRLADVK